MAAADYGVQHSGWEIRADFHCLEAVVIATGGRIYTRRKRIQPRVVATV
jgi:hypothetical protein